MSKRVEQVVVGREQTEGVGARVRRTIGSHSLRRLDPFLLLDEFKGEWPNGFPDHPHRGFETVSYLLQGAFSHEDFTGASGLLEAGDVQWMTAGRGIVHSEIPGKDAGPVRGLQLWVNLRARDKMVEPRYQEKRATDIPRGEEAGVKVAVVAGESMGAKSPVHTLTPACYLDFTMQPGSQFSQPISSRWNSAIYVLEGSVILGDAEMEKTVSVHELAVLSSNGSHISMRVGEDASEGSRFILIGGEPIGEPVVQHGPFVLCTEEELMKTFDDYQKGKNGFERAPGWKSKQGTEALRARGRQL